ncbi:BamA/TamA family outer membrane protein [Sphingomonas sp. KR1UV-12]|uniref:BamA/TamA family outer membrane protein n=1 Tax=Sphingomonas aurea TaxID=3063994 RepID=A0ABT9EFV4_9SPHN|nr:BamA/TamA family outer membrane protein [Sphingomonas sp. KR1UV-12]MDP1025848.1 BamA/TamA family outer membrane protein [Sphingomonas sp. KR1UV-12]
MSSRGRRAGRLAAGASIILVAWAPAVAGAQAPVASAGVPLDPDAPLAPLPGIGVDWPDLSAAPTDDATAATAGTDVVAERRYGWRIDGIDPVATPLLRQRFADNSTLNANDGAPANAAQLDRRAREDAELLTTLLRSAGYYDAQVATRIDPPAAATGRTQVVLEATPGGLYHLTDVTLSGVAAAGAQTPDLTRAFGVTAGDPVDADAIVAGTGALATTAGRNGFPFAQVGEPEVVVDRAAKTATLALAVAPGAQKRFGDIVALPGNRVFGPDHVAEIARFNRGDRFDQARVDDLRRALIQTGLVSSVELKPVDGRVPGTVDMAVKLDPAPPHTVAGEAGYGTGEGARLELSWTHRNLFPPEGALTIRSVLGTQEQLSSLVYRRNNFHGRDRVLTFQVAAAHQNRDAYDAKTYSLSGTLERQTNIFFQKTWTWSLGAELLASDERDVIVSTGAPRRRTFLIGALPTSLIYDGTDDLLNPTRGFRLGGRFSPELSLQGTAFGYARVQFDGSIYRTVSPGVVLAARTRLGTIAGAPRDAVAPSRRFYAGGGASVRGYGYQSIGPRDPNNDPIGGRSLTEFAVEARVKLFGSFGLVPFLDAGNIYTSALPQFDGLRFGTGLGIRYYSNFGPIRLDVGTPINPQRGDSRLAVYVSLGQAF